MREVWLTQKEPQSASLIEQIKNISWPAGAHLAELLENHKLTDWEQVLILNDQEKLVGFVAVLKEDLLENFPWTPFIGLVFVHEDYRGQHLSELLVKKTEEKLIQVGFHEAYIMTRETGRLYEKLGYQKIAETKDKFGHLEEVLHKEKL